MTKMAAIANSYQPSVEAPHYKKRFHAFFRAGP